MMQFTKNVRSGVSDGEWEIRVFFSKCEANMLEYEFKFPSNRTKRISSEHEQEILNKISNANGSLIKRQLFQEWEKKVIIKDNYSKK